MKLTRYILIVMSITLSFAVQAQDYPRRNIDASKLVDDLFGFQDLDLNYDDLYENALQLMANPINLNKATAEDLRFLNILTEEQIQSFLRYREENGDLLSVYEIQSIDNFDLTTIYKLIPFVQVPDPALELNAGLINRLLHEDNNYLITRYERTLEERKGYTSEVSDKQRFKGSPDKYYLRLRTSRPGDFSFGLTAEKDAGEQFKFNSNEVGFDFLSYHAQIQNKGRLKNLIIGDYQFQFAQGLTFGGAFGMGKGGETITTTRRSNIGFMPYTSANEFGLHRGVAVTYALTRHLELSSFLSNTRRDANLNSSDDESSIISSFQITGLHRNQNELDGRKQVHEKHVGVVLRYHTTKLDAGVTYSNLLFDNPVGAKTQPYNQFNLTGNKNEIGGLFLNYNFSNFLFFSEAAKNINGGLAVVGGLMGALSRELDVALLYRKYDRNFQSYYSNAFSESTTPQNESGIYWGWKYRINRQITFSGYADFFHFPWLHFRSYKPSNGTEYLARITYQPSKQVTIFVQAREEKKVRNINGDPSLYQTAEGAKRNYWINLSYSANRYLKMKSRAQFSTYELNKTSTSGMALIQDITIDLGRFEVTARHALFDTDDFDNRQYVYEQDVWLAFSLPAYYGTGIRDFVMLEYSVNKQLTVWFRYARTRYSHADSIGSGVDQIQGNTKNDFKVQLRLKL